MEDLFISNFLRTLLARSGYQVVRAVAQQGIDLLRAGELQVDLVITNTPDVFAAFQEEVPVLYLAAAPDLEQVCRFRACRVLRKPFQAEQLLRAVSELAGSPVR